MSKRFEFLHFFRRRCMSSYGPRVYADTMIWDKQYPARCCMKVRRRVRFSSKRHSFSLARVTLTRTHPSISRDHFFWGGGIVWGTLGSYGLTNMGYV